MVISEVGAIFRSFTPFVNIYMSAMIIDELAGGRDLALLGRYVLITIGLNLIIALVNHAMTEMLKAEQMLMPSRVNFLLSKEGLDMDYANIENVRMRVLRNRIDEAMGSGRGGLIHCFYKQSLVLEIFCKVIIALLCRLKYLARFPPVVNRFFGVYEYPLASAILAVVVLGLSVFSGFSFKKAARVLFNVWLDWPKRMTMSNYYSMEYLGEHGAGKDIRHFNQKPLIESEMRKWYEEPPFITENIKLTVNTTASIWALPAF